MTICQGCILGEGPRWHSICIASGAPRGFVLWPRELCPPFHVSLHVHVVYIMAINIHGCHTRDSTTSPEVAHQQVFGWSAAALFGASSSLRVTNMSNILQYVQYVQLYKSINFPIRNS